MDFDFNIPLKNRLLGLSSQFPHPVVNLDSEDIDSDVYSHVNIEGDELPDVIQENRDFTSGGLVQNVVDLDKKYGDSDSSDSLPGFSEPISSNSDQKMSELQKRFTALNASPQTEVIKRRKCSSEKTCVKNIQKNLGKKNDKNEKVTKKQTKEKAARIRKAEQQQRLAYQPKDCLKFMTVVIDPGIVNQPGVGTAIFNACEDLGVTYKIESQNMPYIVTWKRTTVCYDTENQEVKTWNLDIAENDIMILMPLDAFTEILDDLKLNSMSKDCVSSLNQYAENVQSLYPGCPVTLVVIGSSIGNQANKKSQKMAKKGIDDRLSIEEAFLTLQLRNLFNCQLIQTSAGITTLIRSFTKAVGEKPGKKDRLQSEFSFHNEKGNNSCDSSDTQMMWKLQLQQFKNISSDVANAIVYQYPTPKSLYETYQNCSSEKEGIKILENIMVRRNAGVLQSARRIGKESARRIYQLMTSKDPNLLLK